MASHRTRTFGAEPNCYLLQPNQFLSRIHARKHDVSVSPVHQRTERETCLQFASCNAGSTHSSHAERLDDIRDAEDITLQNLPARRQDPCRSQGGTVKARFRNLRYPVRDSGRRGLPALSAALEAARTGGQCRVLQESDPALVQGQADRRYRPTGRSAMVCLAPCNAGSRGPPGDPQTGRGLRLSPRGLRSLHRYQAPSQAWSRAVPDNRRDWPAEPRSRPLLRKPSSGNFDRAPGSPDRMQEVADPDSWMIPVP